jgi:adenylate cyclase
MKYQVLDRIFKKSLTPRKFERLEIDKNFCILDISPQVPQFSDRPSEVILGKDIRLAFPEFIGIEDILFSILEGHQEVFELEGICRQFENQDNFYIDIYIIGETSEKKGGNILIILLEDVTSRMNIQRRFLQRVHEGNLVSLALSTYQDYMDKIITSMGDVLIVTTRIGQIKKINRATVELFGYSELELINQPISLIIKDNQLFQQALQQPDLFQQYFQNVEVVCQTKAKDKLIIAFSCSVIQKKIAGLEQIICIGRDVTTRETRQKLQNLQYAITIVLSEAQSLKQAMPQILQGICESLGWDLGELWTANEYISTSMQTSRINPVLRCVESWSSRTVAVREFQAITWQSTYTDNVGLPGKIWVTRSPIWIRDVALDCNCQRKEAAAKAGLHGAFGFPILDDCELFGVMVFFSREVQSKNADLLQMMIAIGSQIAQFIKRQRAEEALLESEERYRDLFENANDLIQSVTPYGRFIYVNRAWQETLGYSEAEIAEINIFDIIHPDYREHCRRMFYRLMSGEQLKEVQAAFVTKEGETIFLEGNINCKFAGGKPIATRGIFRNITQRLAIETALRHQQEQTERLLLNVLPEVIANQLKQQSTSIAEDFADVTVLFADIVGFTKIAAEITAIQLVRLLNQIFSAFDRLSEQYGLEKIKTIGDAYMVVAGLPTRYPNHAQAIARMALDMQTAIAQFNDNNSQNFNIRIGIHSGPVVAGVIGLKKFTYDLWGDTVNIASRMESHGMVGRIQVTEATYHHLREEFLLEKRGDIEIKGRGLMTTYFLIGRK